MSHQGKARITGIGSYLPEKVLTNKDLEEIVDTTDDWIVSRTGIKERRIAASNEYTSDMGAAAARKALHSAKLTVDDIDAIIVATMTPDYTSSSVAALIANLLGCEKKIAAFDLQAACSGFLYALSVAKAYVDSGMYQRVLVVASEKMSAFVDYEDRSTCVLFGDGAAAVVVEGKGKGLGIDSLSLGADGSLAELLFIPAGGVRNLPTVGTISGRLHYFKMDGKEVFKHAVRRMSAAAKECLEKAGLVDSQVEWLVPHQANMRIMDAIAKGFSIPYEKMYKTVHKYGNTSASSIAIALDELVCEHQITTGQHILLVAFGAGLTWGAIILTQREI
ncbi:MAG: beta-ketoacyl-ACP synthase III [Parachlamydiaceae bacterium]